MDYYMHVLPGRIRIRTSVLQRNDIKLFRINKFLKSIQGVVSIQENRRIGSVLVHYNQNRTSSQQILSQLKYSGHVPEMTQFQNFCVAELTLR